MSRNNFLQGVVAVILGLIIFGLAISCYMKDRELTRVSLQYEIATQMVLLENQDVPCLDLSVLTTFTWDKVYVFRPYRTFEEIDEILGGFWLGSRFTSISHIEESTLLVFTENGHVVQHVELYRLVADFEKSDNGAGYPVGQACFVKDEHGNMIVRP